MTFAARRVGDLGMELQTENPPLDVADGGIGEFSVMPSARNPRAVW